MVTVTILADHKGVARPRVHGDEYVVDAVFDLDPHAAAGVEILASDLGLSRITAAHITGVEKFDTFLPQIHISATDGSYMDSSGNSVTDRFTIVATDLDGSNASASDADDIGFIRIRAYGLI
tara:strand:- start:946 stop:1311 length:366 start_codon:yes stop_codon:yes gene_type:complete